MIEMGARPEVAIVDGRDTRMRGNPKAIDAKWLQMLEDLQQELRQCTAEKEEVSQPELVPS